MNENRPAASENYSTFSEIHATVIEIYPGLSKIHSKARENLLDLVRNPVKLE